MKAIVLSGGGSRGAYQVGVWKALRRLKIKYDLITGTSIGAFNGALMVQGDYFKAVWIWKNINYSFLFDNVDNDIDKKGLYKLYIKNFIKSGGMDVSKLEKNLEKYIDYKKFYNSKIDFGLVTFNLSSFQPITLTKKEIPRDKLKDYLMASATCFPAFKKKKIDEQLYIDGAYYDNFPINLAIEMGAKEIIAVDLNSLGVKKRIKNKKVKIKYIHPKSKLEPSLIFDKNIAKRQIRLGYNDLMKSFKKLDGNKYTFKFRDFDKNMMTYLYVFSDKMKDIFSSANKDEILYNKIVKITSYYQIINNNLNVTKSVINNTIEYLGEVLKIDDSYIYDIRKYNLLLFNKINTIEDLNISLIEQKIKNEDLLSLFNTSLIVKYLYLKIINLDNNLKLKRSLCRLALVFPKEFMGALYIAIIKK